MPKIKIQKKNMPKIKIQKKNIKIKPSYGIVKLSPTIENLTVNPTFVQQVFTHPNSDGYDTVTVNAISTETLNITPTTSSQQYTGLYETVNVSAVDSSIDSNVQSENIKLGVNILGVAGTLENQADSVLNKSVVVLNLTTNTIGSYSLRGCSNLTTINAPNLTTVASYGCYGCSNLTNINTNSSTISCSTSTFNSCSNLEDFNFEISALSTSAFSGCSKLTKILCTSAVTQISSTSVFANCTSLKTLVLRRTSVVTLKNVNSFENTPFRNGEGGTVYVPNSLLTKYRNATNWSSLESVTFVKIEGSIYE